MKDEMKTNPSCDLISRADAIGAIASAEPKDNEYHYYKHIAIKILSEIPSIEVVGEDTQIEEQARFVAKETELAHIEARLENAEKRLQGACVANFVAEQLERLKDMTDEERLKLLQTMLPSIEVIQGEWIFEPKDAIELMFTKPKCSKCGFESVDDGNFCSNCGARMKGGENE